MQASATAPTSAMAKIGTFSRAICNAVDLPCRYSNTRLHERLKAAARIIEQTAFD